MESVPFSAGVSSLPDAGVAELVDALDLGSSDASRGGSSPSARTTINTEAPSQRRAGSKQERQTALNIDAERLAGACWTNGDLSDEVPRCLGAIRTKAIDVSAGSR